MIRPIPIQSKKFEIHTDQEFFEHSWGYIVGTVGASVDYDLQIYTSVSTSAICFSAGRSLSANFS